MTAILRNAEITAFRLELNRLLIQLKAELEEELRDQISSTSVSEVRDIGEEVEHAVELERQFETLQRHHDEIAECQEALKRIEEGSFGECINCGEEIELTRLKANPTASRCIRCQSIHESALKKIA
ncbi:TraR/DksA family transcriptional regulator [Neptuniibacter sp. QD48_11]|uniref:TraR/DksA family transcriptional regulator n=1 Tax=unclassified Neptuniibacter TaxID=2630693 RepID=UPI0039F62E52